HDLDPDDPEVLVRLGTALGGQGEFARALKYLRRGQELGMKTPNWKHPSAHMIQLHEHWKRIGDRLPDFLEGKVKPKDADEETAVAEVCYFKQLYAASSRFYASAIAAKEKRPEGPHPDLLYDAARAAALAGSGKGKDADRTDVKERARWRKQALAWMRT